MALAPRGLPLLREPPLFNHLRPVGTPKSVFYRLIKLKLSALR